MLLTPDLTSRVWLTDDGVGGGPTTVAAALPC